MGSCCTHFQSPFWPPCLLIGATLITFYTGQRIRDGEYPVLLPPEAYPILSKPTVILSMCP